MQETPSFPCGKVLMRLVAKVIPVSVFYEQPVDRRVIRFCFAKKDETLNAALESLARL